MKKPTVDQNKCDGCGTCIALCPGSFKWNDRAKAEGIFPPAEDNEMLETARLACPTEAISLEDVEGK